MKNTRLITLLLISFIMMILVTGFQPAAAGFFGSTLAVLFAAVLFCSLPLFSFTDTKLCVQMLN